MGPSVVRMSSQPPPTLASERRWLLPAAFLLLGTIWGSSFAWIKVVIEELPPATLVAERMTLGAVAMLALLAVHPPAASDPGARSATSRSWAR